jgi:hypothetical protein
MNVKQLVECELVGEVEVLVENLPQFHVLVAAAHTLSSFLYHLTRASN